MRKNPWIGGSLSLLFPGLGHVYAGKRALGAAVVLGFIVVGNLNALWLSAYVLTPADSDYFGLTLPRLLHDVFAVYGIGFWIWAIGDSFHSIRRVRRVNT